MVSITTSTTSSTASLNGLSTGIDTTALVNAIVAQKATGLNRLKAQQTLNNQKTTALNSLRTELSTLVNSLGALTDKFNARAVTSTDSNNTNVTATATGTVSGSYDLTVHTVATRGRLSATLDGSGNALNMAVANPSVAPVYTGDPATFAVQGTDGTVYKVTLDAASNTLNGLRDKINAVAGGSVTASVVNLGKGTNPYQLVLTAKATGTGSTVGKVSIADITDSISSTNNLGILAGTLDDPVNPTKIVTGGLTSTGTGIATDANFTVNGINLTRSTNVVTDAVEGLTLTLKQGGQTGTTTLTVGQDTAGVTTALQTAITNYNKLVADYKTASTATKNADGSVAQAPLSNDTTTRTLMNSLRAAIQGASAGLSSDVTYKSLASVGITGQSDGTLYLNTYTFQQAMSNDPASVQSLFTFAGNSSNPVVTVKSGGPQTTTGSVDFSITTVDGTLVGALTQGGTTVASLPVTNGVLTGTGIFAGLSLGVSGTGTGTLTLSRGAGQAASDLLSTYIGTTGSIANLLNTITAQNTNLVSQIATAQSRLNQQAADLKDKFAQMEAIVGQMKSTTSSLFGTS